MKKILMVLMGLDIGGAETHVVGLSMTLRQLGWEVLVASNGGVYETVLQEAGIRHFKIPANTRAPRDMIRAYRGLRSLIQEEKPDVVHAHARIPAFLCGILHKKMGFPFVTTAHWVFRVNPLLCFLTDWGQQTVAVSEDIRTYLIDRYDLPASQIHTTVNGIDTLQFSPEVSGARVREEFSIPKDAKVVTCVTRLHESRALSAFLLADCAPELAEAFPGIRLLLVGDGERLEALRRKARQVNSSLGYPCVILAGGRTDVPELIMAGDVFVGVSRAALEAMSCSRPTILCGNEGYGGLATEENAQENLDSNYCCRGNEAASAARLSADILSLLQKTEEERQEIGMAGRELVLRDFSLMTMARDCQKAYELAIHPRKKVVVSGYYGYGNLGDDTILKTICSQYGEDYDLTVLSKRPSQTAKDYGVTAIPRFNIRRVHRAISQCALLLSGGGSLLQDRTSTRSLLYYLAVIQLALKKKKQVMVYANGIGPIRGLGNRRRTVKTLNRVTAITLRDGDSFQELRDMGLSREDLVVTADPVFALKPAEREAAKAMLLHAGIPMDRPLLGISLRTVGKNAAPALARLFDRICMEKNLTPIFLCMQPSVDVRAAEEVMALMDRPGYLLPNTVSAEEMMGVIEGMEAVISMRLHTMIFAAAAGTPVLGFDYDPKITSLLRTLEMPSFGPVEEFDQDKALALALWALEERKTLHLQMGKAAKTLREQARQNETILRGLLGPEPEAKTVLHIIGGGDTGGAKTHVLSLLGGLIERGYRVQLVCFIEGDFAQDARLQGIPTTVLPKNRVLRCLRELRSIIDRLQPDVIHCHGAKANMFGRLLMGKLSKALVTTVHSDPWLDYLGRPMAKLFYGGVNHYSLRKIPYHICVSDTMEQLLVSRGFSPKSLFVIYNGVDFSAPGPALDRAAFLHQVGLSYEEDSVIFGIAARLSPVKDIPTLLEAFSQVVELEPSARLVIAGDGEEAVRLKALAEKLCPKGTVCFAGWLQDTDSFYGAIDVNMLTSLSEGFPYALPEGGKMHCATIATNVGGIPYMVVDGETGLLFSPGDRDALVELMLKMIRQPELRQQLSDNMYRRTREDFSLEATLRTQEEIYHEVLKRERKKQLGA